MGSQGSAVLDFGSFPGASDTSVAVTGEAGIVAGSAVEAWIKLADTATHNADEHRLANLQITAGNISAGVGFTIYGVTPDKTRQYGTYNVWWVWN